MSKVQKTATKSTKKINSRASLEALLAGAISASLEMDDTLPPSAGIQEVRDRFGGALARTAEEMGAPGAVGLRRLRAVLNDSPEKAPKALDTLAIGLGFRVQELAAKGTADLTAALVAHDTREATTRAKGSRNAIVGHPTACTLHASGAK